MELSALKTELSESIKTDFFFVSELELFNPFSWNTNSNLWK